MADQFFGLTDTGRQRDNNEDTFIAQQSADSRFIIACVIDGVGGYSGGEIAAAIAREAVLQRLSKPSGEIIPMLADCFDQANQLILNEKKQNNQYSNMACVATLALIDIEHNQFYYAHVGDTRLYLLRDASLIKISHDQSFVGFLEDSGRLTEEEAMNHPKRNEINKALGFEGGLAKDSDYIETGQSPFLPGDMLLLCSDGLTDMVDKAEITTIITQNTTLKDKCRELVAAANQQGGKDNITVVLAQNNRQATKHNATMPVTAAKSNAKESAPKLTPQPQQPAPQPVIAAKSNKGIIALLSILMLVFLGTAIWQYLQNNQLLPAPSKPVVMPVIKLQNKQELKLQAAINDAKGHVLILWDTTYTSPVVISKAIVIDKDSLLIKAHGKIEFQADSGYNSPAFTLSGGSKKLLLDSLSFSNFKTGIMAANNALQLKNIRFINCVVPVVNTYAISPKKYISGKILPAVFKADSLPVTNKRK